VEILSGIQHPHEEDQLAFRNGQQYVSRLLRRAAPSGPVEQFMPDKTYLITGGLGGLGLEVAKWMAGRGARNLALVGRRAPSSEAITAIEDLRQNGTSVEIYAADVSSMPQMEGVFRDTEERMAGLGGIIHCAGVLDDGVLTQLTPERMERVLAPKVAGAWNLHRLTAERPLEFFVLFSSVASIIGSSGQASYAAANGFLDGLACYRRSSGLTALTINWGGWAETGMAARSVTARRRATPLKLMPTASALAAMGAALSGSPQMCIAEIDWALYKSAYKSRPFLSQVEAGPDNTVPPSKDRKPGSSILEKLNDAPESSRLALIRNFVQVLAVRVLEFPPGRSVDPQQPLSELGLDSLMALELRNALAAELSQSLPATLLFNYPAIDDISTYVHARLFGITEKRNGPPSSEQRNSLDDIEEMSDEEVDRMLTRRLGAVP
jgi:NAD(P)-dependent dehydrogenase (short-subunit alcohol dehydrogenase family)/acyl carrier protein